MDGSTLSRLPGISVLSGTALLGLATAWYPGGYRWSEHTISALFQPATPAGLVNPARLLAVIGVLTAMIGVALQFYLVSKRTRSPVHRTAIRIAGIASTVFAALTVALPHDLMVGLALVCFVVAVIAVLPLLRPSTPRVPSRRSEGCFDPHRPVALRGPARTVQNLTCP
jgi:cytochrome bd-type quinol oxidase subunit 2